MTSETINVNIRMDKNVKEQYEKLCKSLGMNMTTAFNIFATAMVRQKKIPFEISLEYPNEETLRAMDDAINHKNIYGSYTSVKDVMEALNAPD